jgi:hypothetical protein
MAELKEFKAGQRVRVNGEEPEGVVTFVFDHRAGMFDEVNVLWDGGVTPMPVLTSKLEIIAGAVVPADGGGAE